MNASREARTLAAALAALLFSIAVAHAQGTPADYERANGLRTAYEALVSHVSGPATWIGSTGRFWYRVSTKGAYEFIVFDVAARQKRPAFDHEKIAAALSKATGGSYTASKLPFTSMSFADDEKSIDVTVDGTPWTCTLSDYSCRKAERRQRRA